jgi:hypothetical protein
VIKMNGIGKKLEEMNEEHRLKKNELEDIER